MQKQKSRQLIGGKKEKSRFRRLSRRICRKRRSILRSASCLFHCGKSCWNTTGRHTRRTPPLHAASTPSRMVAQHLLRSVHAALRQEGVERRSSILAQQARQVRLADANIGADTRDAQRLGVVLANVIQCVFAQLVCADVLVADGPFLRKIREYRLAEQVAVGGGAAV